MCRGTSRQRSRADPIGGVKSNISVAMARAGTALSESSVGTIPETITDMSPENLMSEITTLNERIETLEVINADAFRTIETLSQQKSTIESKTI